MGKNDGSLDHAPRVIALATGRHLAEPVQRRLVEHLDGGGGLLLLGKLPELDLEGRQRWTVTATPGAGPVRIAIAAA